MGHQGKSGAIAPPRPQAWRCIGPAGRRFAHSPYPLHLAGETHEEQYAPPPRLQRAPRSEGAACRNGGRVCRIFSNDKNQATTPGPRRGAHGTAKGIEAVLVIADTTHPRVGGRVISHVVYLSLETIIASRELRHLP